MQKHKKDCQCHGMWPAHDARQIPPIGATTCTSVSLWFEGLGLPSHVYIHTRSAYFGSLSLSPSACLVLSFSLSVSVSVSLSLSPLSVSPSPSLLLVLRISAHSRVMPDHEGSLEAIDDIGYSTCILYNCISQAWRATRDVVSFRASTLSHILHTGLFKCIGFSMTSYTA